mgnify:CR=1 FL=1
MKRRGFIGRTAIAGGVGAAALAAPAWAAEPTVRWRMSTAWPKSLDNMYGLSLIHI